MGVTASTAAAAGCVFSTLFFVRAVLLGRIPAGQRLKALPEADDAKAVARMSGHAQRASQRVVAGFGADFSRAKKAAEPRRYTRANTPPPAGAKSRTAGLNPHGGEMRLLRSLHGNVGRERRLILEDVALLRAGDPIILLYPFGHPTYDDVRKLVEGEAEDSKHHYFERDGISYVQIEATITNNPKGDLLLQGVIGKKTRTNFSSKGSG